jgi:hypothetical protein
MCHILAKIENFFLRFCMDLYYIDIVWNIFWRNLKKNFLRFSVELYCKAILWVIFSRKLKFFFCVSVWIYTVRLYYGSYFREN